MIMSTRNLIYLIPNVTFRNFTRRYGYKTVRRPDPNTLRMPPRSTAPSILDIMKEKIKLNGPMTVAEFMHVVVTNPTEGYYTKKDVIGSSGDFITSPEISQLFGEMVGIWFCNENTKLGLVKPFQIVELGPGKGTLLKDILKVLHKAGYKSRDVSLHLVEVSETMLAVQASALCASHKAAGADLPYYHEGETISGIKVYWYYDLKKVPQEYSWYIAHEFFDVLPIHKFEKTKDGWREVLIELDENGKFNYRISANETTAVKTLIKPPLDTGDRTDLEISARALGIARQLATRVDQCGGLALIADYGHEGEKGDTFRAFHKHQVVDPLEKVGECDLTADVDFKQLRLAASKSPLSENYALVVGPVKQKDFLQRCHAELRLEVLLENAKTEEEKEQLKSAFDMLVNPDKMGDRFKFMAFYPSSVEDILNKYPPFGFAT